MNQRQTVAYGRSIQLPANTTTKKTAKSTVGNNMSGPGAVPSRLRRRAAIAPPVRTRLSLLLGEPGTGYWGTAHDRTNHSVLVHGRDGVAPSAVRASTGGQQRARRLGARLLD